MNVIVLNEPGCLALEERPDVGAPRWGEALVRVERVGICGTDIHAFRGRQPFFSYPRVLGHELAVRVEAVGDADSPVGVGDLCAVEPYLNCGSCRACRTGKPNCCEVLQVLGVHVDGGMQPLLHVPIRKLHRTPGISADQAALVETLAIGCHAVERSRLREWPQQARVLVVGAGPIGLAATQFASLQAARVGAAVAVLDVSPARRAFCRDRIGVQVLAPEEAAPKRFDVVFDATGNPASMAGAFERVEHGGTLIFIGLFPGEVTFHDPLFHRREITLLASRNALPGDFSFTINAIAQGHLDTAPWITHRVHFNDFPTVFPLWLEDASLVKGVIEL